MLHSGVRTLLMCFVLASLTLPLTIERPSSAQQADRGQGVKSTNAAKPERRVALVIGNGNYSVRPLANPPNDARALAAALKDLGFEVLSGENLTLAEMRQKLRAFGASLRGSVVGLFFFAGHGVQVNGVNYLIPIGANIETEPDVELEAVSASNVLSQMDAAENPVNVLILDACRDNPFRGFRRSGARGLTQVRALPGTLIAYATAPDDTAADGKGANSPYTTEILRHIRTPGLKIEDFFKLVRLGVEEQTSRRQTPWESSSLRGDFYFVPPLPVAPVTPIPAPSYLAEQSLWETVRESSDPAEIERYTRKYCPNGIYCDAAEIRLARLKARTSPTTTPNTNAPTSAPAVAYAKVAGSRLPLIKMEFTTARVDARGNVSKMPEQPVNGYVEDLGNGMQLEMVEIAGRAFMMGSPTSESGRGDDEILHSVTVESFYLGRYEVTQAQWKAVMGSLPLEMSALSKDFKDDRLPVVRISWNETKEFCRKLNAKLKLSDADGYRLPTEAEWELAARAGSKGPFAFGETITPDVVNYNGEVPYSSAAKGKYIQHPVAVGRYPANAWGLFDLHGNVWEWCDDLYADYEHIGIIIDALRDTRSDHVIRGGSWLTEAGFCRSAVRVSAEANLRRRDIGFRLARTSR